MSGHYLSTMQQVLQLSEEMLRHAEQGEWEKVNGLEAKRNALLGQHGTLPTGDEAAEASDVVRQIMSLNEKLLQLGKTQLGSYVKERGELSKGRRAVAAYGG